MDAPKASTKHPGNPLHLDEISSVNLSHLPDPFVGKPPDPFVGKVVGKVRFGLRDYKTNSFCELREQDMREERSNPGCVWGTENSMGFRQSPFDLRERSISPSIGTRQINRTGTCEIIKSIKRKNEIRLQIHKL